jgi:UDP:flavonoid glycosyltransferase YjiC (YdhE family)
MIAPPRHCQFAGSQCGARLRAAGKEISVRILFTTHPVPSHFYPLVPLAQALQDAGHAVAFAAGVTFCPFIESSGFRAFPAGFDHRGIPPPRLFRQMQAMNGEQFALFMETIYFALFSPPLAIPDLVRISHDWEPDVIVREAFEFGGCIAAEHIGIPHAVVEVGSYRGPWFPVETMVRQLDRVRRGFGLPPDPDLTMLARYLHLSFAPPRYQDPASPLPPTAHALRYRAFDQSGEEALPEWVAQLPDLPTVYATLGTGANRASDLFEAIIAAVRDEPVNLIITIGRNNDPAAFGDQPANVHIERYIPQTLLLPHCDMVIAHGGWGTTMGALASGLPLVVMPITADQPQNAARCAALGVGRVVAPDERTPEGIRAAVREVLGDDTFRERARGLGEEIAAMPGQEHAVALLERLAAEKRPILAGA